MRIEWLGHAAFLITGEDGKKIITDPFGKYDGLNYTPINEWADIVLVSHKHGDHVGGKVGKNPVVVDKAGNTEAKGVMIRGVDSHHDPSGGSQRGDNVIFCFTLDGIRICHLGDLGHVFTSQQITEIGEVDVLLIPVGGFFTIDANEANQVCDQLKPKVIIPMHVSNEKCSFPIAKIDDFLVGKSNVEWPGRSDKDFFKEDLPSEPQIIVLKHAL